MGSPFHRAFLARREARSDEPRLRAPGRLRACARAGVPAPPGKSGRACCALPRHWRQHGRLRRTEALSHVALSVEPGVCDGCRGWIQALWGGNTMGSGSKARDSARVAVTGRSRRSVILFELNEADRHFLDAFLDRGLLPAFARMRDEGTLLTTRIPTWKPTGTKAWHDISPWMVWPSIYTGMDLEAHGIVAFGQDTSILEGRCIWDVLDGHGVPVGVCGSLMSFPPRSRGHASFYVPESLANTPDCFPAEARALQEFCVFTARNYSEEFGFGSNGLRALRLLLRTSQSGVRKRTLLRVLAQTPGEKLVGRSIEAERAMLHSNVVFDAFRALYQRYRPAFATLHMNHVAYMQHRFWRAAEPHRFRAE